MKKIKIILPIIIVLILLAGVLLYNLPDEDTILPVENTIKIAYLPFDASLPYFVAKEKGFFSDLGLDVKGIMYKSPKTAMDALLTGKIDAIVAVGSSTIIAAEIKAPDKVKIIHSGSQTNKDFVNYILVRSDSDINSIHELIGKKIGSYKSSTAKLVIKLLNKKIFGDADATDNIQVAPELQGEALVSNQFDALYTVEPYATIIRQKTGAKVLEANPLGKYILNPWPSGGSVISSEFASKKSVIAKKLTFALDRSIDYIREKPIEAKRLLALYTPIDEETAISINTYHWQKSSENKYFAENFQKLSEILFTEGVVDKSIDTSSLYYDIN